LVARVNRFAILMSVSLVASAGGTQALAQAPSEAPPPPPESAPPATAPPAQVPEGLPPHPAFPEPLDEPQPTTAELAQTEYVWLPGHWTWTGDRYEWETGYWIYPLPGHVLVPPRWEWNGESWVFHNAGWAPIGSDVVAFAPVAVTEGDLAGGEPVDVYVEPRSPLYWTVADGYYAPLILYPRWHPYYHYYYALGHPFYVQYAPLYYSPWYRYYRYGTFYRGRAYRPPVRPLPRYRPAPYRATTVRRTVGPSSYYRAKPSSWSSRSSYRPPSYPRGTGRTTVRSVPKSAPSRTAPAPRSPSYRQAPRSPGYSPAPRSPSYRQAPRSPGYSPAPRSPGYSPAPRGPSYSPPSPSRPPPMQAPPGRGGGGGPRR
jgi:hypothetical protein